MKTKKESITWEIIKQIGWKGFIWLAAVFGIAIFGWIHTFNQTTPQRWADPVNWIISGVVVVLLIIGKVFKIS